MNAALKDLILREENVRQIMGMLFDEVLIIQDGVIIETNLGLISMTGYETSEKREAI